MWLLFNTPFAQLTNPDLGFQLSICVNTVAEQFMIAALRMAVTTPVTVGSRMITLVPPGTPLDIRAACASDRERLALWLPSSPQPGRDMALRLPSRLLQGENYVQEISLRMLRFAADRVWNDPMTPRRLPLPDPFPAAMLNTLEVTLERPNRVITRISGIVRIAVLPDVRFSITFTDMVFVDSQGRVQCMPVGLPQVSVSNGLLVGPLRTVANVFANAFVGQRGQMVGLGCLVLQGLAPGFIDTNTSLCGRISFPYSRIDVDSAGVTLGSRAPLASCLQMARVMEEPFRAPR